MDLLAKRYASPFTVLEEMIRAGRFYDFVVEINAITSEETYEERLWEIWLHKIFNMEWSEWRESIRSGNVNHSLTESDLEATITASHELLTKFNPDNLEK